MSIIIELFSGLTDIELTSAVQCILEPLKCSHRASQEVYKKRFSPTLSVRIDRFVTCPIFSLQLECTLLRLSETYPLEVERAEAKERGRKPL